jgi:hypothetical protein
MNRLLLRISLVFAAAFVLSACATHATAHPASARGYSVRVESPHGGALPTYHQKGRTYVLGHYDDRYNVRVTNHTGRRVEAVVTVDGRNVISGEVGDYTSQRGYIIDPHGSVLVEGFRKSMSGVAAFRFTDPGDAYSSRMGTPQHLGVIGVAVFREREPVAWRRPKPMAKPRADGWGGAEGRAEDSAGAPSSASKARPRRSAGSLDDMAERESSPAPQNLGTRYGEHRHSPAVQVSFVRARANRPDSLLAVYYDDVDGLARRGIPVHPRYSGDPSPFPSNQRFAPPPPRY